VHSASWGCDCEIVPSALALDKFSPNCCIHLSRRQKRFPLKTEFFDKKNSVRMGSTLPDNPYYPPEYSLFGMPLNSGNRTITQRINRKWRCYSKKSLYHSPSTNYHSAIFCNSIMPRIGLYFSQFSSSKFWIVGRITEGLFYSPFLCPSCGFIW